MSRAWLKTSLATVAALLAALAFWSVALADDPAPPAGAPAKPANHVYYQIAEVKYSLHDTRLESCLVCHSWDGTTWGLNPYGSALLTQLGAAVRSTDPQAHKKIWDALIAIEGADSDDPDGAGPLGDGQKNGTELWSLSNPGDVNDKFEEIPSTDGLGGVHGAYGETPDACARCHRTHTAQAPLLLQQAQKQLCYSCHDGSVASTNVKMGILGADGGLKGGGFESTKMQTDPEAVGVSVRPPTSTHTITGTAALMWGWDGSASGAGKAGVTLECGNCHDPHMPTWTPDGGATKFTQYRMLQGSPRESGAGENRQARGFFLSVPGTPAQGGYTQEYVDGRPKTNYQTNDRVGEFCALCHTRYMANTVIEDSTNSYGSLVSRKPRAGDAIFTYQHATKQSTCSSNSGSCHASSGLNPDPAVPYFGGASRPQCIDCHVSHGTGAQMTGWAKNEDTPGGKQATLYSFWPGSGVPGGDGQPAEGVNRSSLLRVDNRGVCTLCHEK